ncbi:hypothetical protein C8R43DRAFT_952566 [Mycena crocata]|nr:hypothetical protein C8R43DRAFT_952566 [Mycena crocata]
MPSQLTPAQIRLNTAAKYLSEAVKTIEVIADAFEAPFLAPISMTSRSLLTAVQTVEQNRNDCARLLEHTHCLLYAIIDIHVKSTTGPDLPPSMLKHLGKFTETLYKIHTYVEAQQDKSKIRQFFRQGEMKILLKACTDGLQNALDVFKVQHGSLPTEIADKNKYAEDRHQEVLRLIEALSDDSVSERSFKISYTLHNR